MTLSVILFWTVITYIIASIPFALLLGWFVLGKDIRSYGDGNPGATNVHRAGGSLFWYVIALLLDGCKGLFPVGILYWLHGWYGYEIVPIAVAAIAGHAFSVFLRFQGGKAIAVTSGVWAGLILLEAILVIPTMLTYWFYVVEENEWAVMLMLGSLLIYLLLTRPHQYPLLLVWLGNALIVAHKHRDGLTGWPTLRHGRNGD